MHPTTAIVKFNIARCFEIMYFYSNGFDHNDRA